MGGNKTYDADVIVVGGGPAGCTMAALLAASGISVICIDRDDPAASLRATFDGRTTAISFGSRRVIDAAGAWDTMEKEANPISDIKIMDSGSDTLLEFMARDVGESAFGWIVENRILRAGLYQRLSKLPKAVHMAPAGVKDYAVAQDSVSVFLGNGKTMRAQLVIGADGKKSFTRDWMGIDTRGHEYHQMATVCVVTHENPHNNIAVEDFRGEGPFAILPMTDDKTGAHRSSIVWTEHAPKKPAAQWDEESFNAAIAERFPAFYGQVRCAGPRSAYPLGLSHAHSYTGRRMALIADAAHAIHPIAGQGLNLGLRDVAALAELLIKAKTAGRDLGGADILQNYERMRRTDNMLMAGTTHTLNALFSNEITPLRFLRRAGLRAIKNIPSAKRFFMKQAMGSSGLLPALVRQGKF